MSWPFRTSRAVTALSPEVEALLRGGPAGGTGATGSVGDGAPTCVAPELPGEFKARFFAAYERRGRAPTSGLRLLVGEIRWPAAALSAVAGACVVMFAGASSGGDPIASRSVAPVPVRVVGEAGVSRAGERQLAFVGGDWEHVHPLPTSTASVRVVDDQNLPLIGVGWTPDLDGP